MNSRWTLAVLALSALIVVTGCSDDGAGNAADATPRPTTTTTVAPTPSITGAPDVAEALQVLDSGGRVTCLEVTSRSEVGLWVDSLRATVPLRIEGVESVGSRSQARGGIAVPVIAADANGAIIDEWPPSAPTGRMAKRVDWDARSSLVGLRMDAGEEVRPVLHLAGAPGDRLSGVEIAFVTEDEGVASSVAIPLDLKFARSCG